MILTLTEQRLYIPVSKDGYLMVQEVIMPGDLKFPDSTFRKEKPSSMDGYALCKLLVSYMKGGKDSYNVYVHLKQFEQILRNI